MGRRRWSGFFQQLRLRRVKDSKMINAVYKRFSFGAWSPWGGVERVAAYQVRLAGPFDPLPARSAHLANPGDILFGKDAHRSKSKARLQETAGPDITSPSC